MDTKQVLEALILAAGIYFFLRFLQSTRGGGVLRGLVVMFVFGFVGLVLVGELLELEELQYVVSGITPYVAVIFTILFQPELRKAISRLGEHNRLARFFGERRSGTVQEVVRAAVEMAGRRQGALIAIQRDTPLEPHVQNAVPIDAEVRRLLLESIFHVGSALHDGGVLIVGDRVAAAACIFPLSENPDLGKSVGTRHRAALGLSEETDAVVLVVSEETGAISIARDGRIDRHIAPERLEAALLEHLGFDPEEAEGGRRAPRVRITPASVARSLQGLLVQHPLLKLASLLLAGFVILFSHDKITTEATVRLQVVRSDPENPVPRTRQALEVRLPGEDYVLVSPTSLGPLEVQISGTRGEVERVKDSLSGLLTVGADLPAGGVPFPLDEVAWSAADQGELELLIRWALDEPPRLEVERFDELEISLEPGLVQVDDSQLNRRLQVLEERTRFSPDTLVVRGPVAVIDEIRAGAVSPLFEPIQLTRDDKSQRGVSLKLAAGLLERNVRIVRSAQAILDILPTRHTLESLVKEIEILPDPEHGEDVRYTIKSYADRATFDILTTGIMPDNVEPGQQAFTEISGAIRQYVETHLEVVVRVRDLRGQDGNTVPVISFWPPANWRAELSERLGWALDEFAELDVSLKSEPRVRLAPPEED